MKRFAVSILCLLILTPAAWAQNAPTPATTTPGKSDPKKEKKKPFEFKVSRIRGLGAYRTDAPLLVDVTITNNTKKMATGPLDFVVGGPEGAIAQLNGRRVTAPPTGRPTTYRIMLPPMTGRYDAFSDKKFLDLDITFRTKDRTHNLGREALAAPNVYERNMVLAVAGSAMAPLAKSLNIQRLRPAQGKLGGYQAQIRIDKMPGDPMGYTAFDTVLIPDLALGQLSKRQIEAMTTWTRAGGSLCVVVGVGLKDAHVENLNALIQGDRPNVAISLAEDRTPLLSPMPEGGIGRYQAGLGRLLLVMPDEAGPHFYESPTWRQHVGWLWKVQRRHEEGLVFGPWKYDEPDKDQLRDFNDPNFGTSDDRYGIWGMAEGGSLGTLLMPQDVQIVPLWITLMILGAFVLVIGPGEYLLLGAVRLRKLTWIVFPLTALGFTLVTFTLANAYMGQADHRRTLDIRDVAVDGRVVRQTQIQMVYPASNMTVETEITGGLLLQIDPSEVKSQMAQNPDDDKRPATPVYSGSLPAKFKLTQPIQQWTTSFYRLTRFGAPAPPDPGDPKIRWHRVARQSLGDGDTQAILKALLDGDMRPTVVLLHRNESQTLQTGARLGDGARADQRFDLGHADGFLREATARKRAGFFSAFAQLSPNGGSHLEDLAMLDTSDPNAYALIVMYPKDDSLIAYRRLYPGAP